MQITNKIKMNGQSVNVQFYLAFAKTIFRKRDFLLLKNNVLSSKSI